MYANPIAFFTTSAIGVGSVSLFKFYRSSQAKKREEEHEGFPPSSFISRMASQTSMYLATFSSSRSFV